MNFVQCPKCTRVMEKNKHFLLHGVCDHPRCNGEEF